MTRELEAGMAPLPTLISLMVLVLAEAEARTGALSVTFIYKPFLWYSFCLLCLSISEWLILVSGLKYQAIWEKLFISFDGRYLPLFIPQYKMF